MPAPGAPRYQSDKNRFRIEIDGITHASFQTCSELAVEVGEILYREGGDMAPTAKDPGLYNVPDVTLGRGSVADDSELWDWFVEVADFSTNQGSLFPLYRRTVDIVVLDRDYTTTLERWRLYDVWPKRFVAGEWDAEAEEKLIIQLVLSVRGIDRVFPV